MAEFALLGSAFLLLAYTAWARGGTYAPWQWPMLALGAIIPALRIAGSASGAGGSSMRRAMGDGLAHLVRDPVFLFGGLFLALLAVQAWNCGRPLVFDPALNAWRYDPPPVPWLPFSFTAREGREMLVWFAPAWALAVGLRAPWLRAGSIYTLWSALVVNAAALALFGVAQFASGATRLLGGEPAGHERFFASFAYSNHAGAYFVLMFCLSGGLWIRDVLGRPTIRFDGRAALRLSATIPSLAGAFLSVGRASILLATGAAAAMVAVVSRRAWRRLRPASRLHLVAGLLAVGALAYFLIAGAGRDPVARELASLAGDRFDRLLAGNRLALASAAVDVWRESPWFGCGGWGFRYQLAFHLPPDLAGRSLHGLANVHNDLLQFLAEFGGVGVALMLATLAAMVRPAIRAGLAGRPALQFAAAGAFLTTVQSAIDLPFRCPAVLYAWVVVVVGISCLAGDGRRRGVEAGGDQRR